MLLTNVLSIGALPQSGRGRPKVSQPSPSSSQPQPVTVPAAATVTAQEQLGTTSRFVLRNGMTVVISEQHSTPIVAAVAYFKVGVLGESGMNLVARLVDHMIVKGTTSDRAMADLRSLGASIESGASYDGAVYSLLAPSEKVKDALAIQANMLQNPSFDSEAMRKETSLVIEEKRLAGAQDETAATASEAIISGSADIGNQGLPRMFSYDSPATFSMSRLIDAAFGSLTPASIEALRSMTREQLTEFYQGHYRPDNLIISVVGDVSTFETLVAIQQLYGGFAAKPASESPGSVSEERVKAAVLEPPRDPSSTPHARSPVPSPEHQRPAARTVRPESSLTATVKMEPLSEQSKVHYTSDRADITQSVVSIGFHVPGVKSKDWPALEVLSTLVGQGRASRLSSSLIDGQMVANRIESNYAAFADEGLLTIQMTPAAESREGASIDRAESALFKELDRLRRGSPTEGEMARAKTLLEKRMTDETGNYLGRAKALARAQAAGVDVRLTLASSSRIRAVTAEDVQRAAARYLVLSNTSIHEYEPLSAPTRSFDDSSFATTVTAWAPGFAGPVESVGAPSTNAASPAPVPQGTERSPEQRMLIESMQPLPIRDFSTLNGPKAFVREDHSQPEVTVAILFQGGRLIEDAQTSGITELMLRSILYGTPRRPFFQVSQELEQLGADVQLVAEPDYFGIILSVLSRNADRALKLVREEIEEPAFRDDDIARARLAQIGSIRTAHDSGMTQSYALLLQALFSRHPYSLSVHGREEVITALTSDKLRDWHQRVIKRQLPVAIIVGDTDGSALVSSQIAEGFRRRDVDTVTQVKVPQVASPTEKVEQRRREQTTIAIGFSGPKADSPDLASLELVEAAMNRDGGRLARELRDKQNAISSGATDVYRMFVGGAIVAYVVTTPENEQRARAALVSEFEKIARSGLTLEELANARAVAVTSRTARLQSQSQHAIEYANAIFYRRQVSDADNFAERSSRVTSEDIKRVSSVYFKASAAFAGIVRGASPPPVSPQKPN